VQAVQRTLESGRSEWRKKFSAPTNVVAGVPDAVSPRADSSSAPASSASGKESSSFAVMGRDTVRPSTFVTPDQPASLAARLEPSIEVSPPSTECEIRSRPDQQFQIIGVLNRLYVLMENSDGLVLVDQHAAHERILFEELRHRMEEQGVPAQRMLLPQIFSLPSRDAEWVESNVATLQKMGIGIESFGPNSFRVDTLPAFLEIADAAAFLREVIDELKTTARSTSPLRLGEDMIARTVCRHAVKANDPLRYPEIEKLIRDLLACDLPYCCPHGRPTMIQISHTELEKKFGRKA
jgi:DNA mismatch repair protein MutL